MSLRVAFMGSPEFAVPSLRATHRACDLRVVVSQPDRPAGRGQRLSPPAVKTEAEQLGVPVLQPRKMRDGTLAQTLKERDLDLVVVVAFGRILPQDLLDVPRHGCINVHASLLPRWRGAAPVQRAIQAGDTETGVAIMRMEAGMDTGPVYRTVRTPIDSDETSGQLLERLSTMGADALEDFLLAFPHVPDPTAQDDAQATLAPLLRKEEGEVSWHKTVRDIVNHVRAMDPWPGAFTERQGARIKLFGATAARTPLPRGAVPGEVVSTQGDEIQVACLDALVSVAEIQPAGKRRMRAMDYVRGSAFTRGECLG
jgi:methionyl-tRNA formyltransferase